MLGVKSATGAKGPVVPWPEVTVLVLSWLRLDLGVSVIPRLSEWGQLLDFPGNVGTFGSPVSVF